MRNNDNSMSFNIEEMGQWLHSQNEAIEIVTRKELTLMDIMGISHLENQWSKIYQFFLTSPSDSHTNHGFGDVFIRSLEQFLKERGLNCYKGWLNNYEVITEYPCKATKDDKSTYKRIDILIREKHKKGNKQKAIIIENKVRHTLDENNLALYAKTIFNKGCTDIILIVLTLDRIDNSSVYLEKSNELEKLKTELRSKTLEYVNITHVEYMKKIEESINKEFIIKSKYDYLFKDFYRNIMNQANVMTDEEYRFFNENYLNIKKVSEIYNKIVENTYKPQLENVFKERFFFKFFDNQNDTFIRLGYKERDDVYLTIFIDRLWKEDNPYITIILELQRRALNSVQELEKDNSPRLKNIRNEINIENIKFHDDNGVQLNDNEKDYMHYASWDEEIKDKKPDAFAKYLKERINDNLPIYKLGTEIINLLNNLDNKTI